MILAFNQGLRPFDVVRRRPRLVRLDDPSRLPRRPWADRRSRTGSTSSREPSGRSDLSRFVVSCRKEAALGAGPLRVFPILAILMTFRRCPRRRRRAIPLACLEEQHHGDPKRAARRAAGRRRDDPSRLREDHHDLHADGAGQDALARARHQRQAARGEAARCSSVISDGTCALLSIGVDRRPGSPTGSTAWARSRKRLALAGHDKPERLHNVHPRPLAEGLPRRATQGLSLRRMGQAR